MAETLRFRSPDERQRRLCLPSGHVVLVGSEWTALPEMYHSTAYAEGCIVEEERSVDDQPQPSREAAQDRLVGKRIDPVKLKNFLKKAVSADAGKGFEIFNLKNRTPVLGKVRASFHPNVDQFMLNEAWRAAKDELDAESRKSPQETENNLFIDAPT